jgi:hypothetical protein
VNLKTERHFDAPNEPKTNPVLASNTPRLRLGLRRQTKCDAAFHTHTAPVSITCQSQIKPPSREINPNQLQSTVSEEKKYCAASAEKTANLLRNSRNSP